MDKGQEHIVESTCAPEDVTFLPEGTPPPPAYDYASWGYKDPFGLRGKNQSYLTRSLFLESNDCRRDVPPVYTMRESAAYSIKFGIWVPSARQIYLHSNSEYEAYRKLVGSKEQWDRLLMCDWFVNGFPEKGIGGLKEWREELRLKKLDTYEKMLAEAAMNGNTQAAKALFDNYRKNATVGRPPKTKEDMLKATEDETQKDVERVLKLVKKASS